MEKSEWLDEVVGADQWPDSVDLEQALLAWGRAWGKATIAISANASSAARGFAVAAAAFDEAMRATKKQSDYILWPPPEESSTPFKIGWFRPTPILPQFTMPSRKDLQRNLNEASQLQTTRRALRSSRPIGSQGCGFVWNRGRVRS